MEERNTLLIVDDFEFNRLMLSDTFSDRRVIEAENGKRAIEEFEKNKDKLCAVLLDIMMPVMNGLDATRYIRKLERADSKTVPIIAMTANAYTDDIEISIKAGMNGHLSKPLNTTELKEIIGKYYCIMKENI